MRVTHSHVNLAVSEYFLNRWQIDTIHNHIASRRVAQIMKMEVFNFRLATCTVKSIIDGSLPNLITPWPANKIFPFAVL
ncbi:MAG TPA: hypothetical protein VIE89_01065 [Candidatus Binatia bacterium]